MRLVRLPSTILTPAQSTTWRHHLASLLLLLTCQVRLCLRLAQARWGLGGGHRLERRRRVTRWPWVQVVRGGQEAST